MKEVATPAPLEGEGDSLEKTLRQVKEHPGQPIPGQVVCWEDTCTGKAVSMTNAIGRITLSSGADRVVIDETGLKGYYDFSLTRVSNSNDSAAMQQIEEDLGLRFEPRRQTVKKYVIDSAVRPAEN